MLERFFKARAKSADKEPVDDDKLVAALDPAATLRVRMLFSGRVQGVGFRFMQQQFSDKREITGWVKNLDDGNVEAEWQGTGANIQAMVADLHVYYRQFGYGFTVVACDELPLVPDEKGFRAKY